MPENNPTISIEGLHKTFIVGEKPSLWRRITGPSRPLERIEVLKGVDLTVRQGEVVVLLGSSGSGKSTLLRCINKLETIDGGRIYVNGHLIGYQERDGALIDEKSTETAIK